MQIYEILKKDHDEVQELLAELIALDDKDDYRMVLIQQIADALIPHARAEETAFYNTLRSIDAESGKVMHGYKEHLQAETLLKALQVEEATSLPWKETAKKLSEALDHHIQEEESEIFSIARQALTEEEAEAIGEAFTEVKAKVSQQGDFKNALEFVKNLLPPTLTDRFTPSKEF